MFEITKHPKSEFLDEGKTFELALYRENPISEVLAVLRTKAKPNLVICDNLNVFQRSCFGYLRSEVEFDMDHIFSMTPISKMYRMGPIELAKVKK